MHATIAQNVRMPTLGYGTWRLAGDSAKQGVMHALELGCRHIDTAQLYGNEVEVGAAIRDTTVPREDVFLTTKVWIDAVKTDQVVASVEESLSRLATPYVDLLLIHWPVPTVPVEKTLGELRSVQERGLTRHIGVSNFTASLLREAARHAPIAANQVEYHAKLGQQAVLEAAREVGAAVTAYCPLAQGNLVSDPVLVDIGRQHHKTAAQVAIRWLAQQPGVAAIPKSSRRPRIASNLDVFDFELTEEDLSRIAALQKNMRTCDPPIAPRWDPQSRG